MLNCSSKMIQRCEDTATQHFEQYRKIQSVYSYKKMNADPGVKQESETVITSDSFEERRIFHDM